MKFTITITLLLLSSPAIICEISQTKIIEESLAQPPTSVIDTSRPSDDLFANALDHYLFFSPGDTNETIYIWSVNWDDDATSNKTIIKRTIDASTLQPKGEDITLPGVLIKPKVGVFAFPGIGYIGFSYLREDDESASDQLYFSILPASASSNTSAIDVKLMSETYTGTSFYINDAWFQDGYFYVLFTEFEMSESFEKTLYLQAIKCEDGSLLFSSAVKVASFSNLPGSTMPVAGPNNSTNATLIYIVYKDDETKTVMQTTVTVSNGKVNEPTKLVTDTDNETYYTADVISALDVFGVVVVRQEMQKKNITESLKVYYNGATSKPQMLDISAPKDYKTPEFPMVQSFNHKDGFVVIAEYTGEPKRAYVIRVFNADGSERAAQKTLGYFQGSLMFFEDAAGALWLGYTDYDTTTDRLSKSYLVKVLE